MVDVMPSQDGQEIIDDYLTYRNEADNEAETESLLKDMERFKSQPEVSGEPQQDQPQVEQPDVEEEGVGGPGAINRAVFKDIGMGTLQAPRSVARGAAQGINEIFDIASDIENLMNLPILQITDKEGNFDLDLVSQETAQERGLEPLSLPVPDESNVQSNTGEIIEKISQFLTGFGVAGKALKGVKTASRAGQLAKNAIQGAIGDILAFDEQENRLSDIIQSVPALQNPVTEFLEADPDDNVALAKFKQGVEGLGLGALTDGIIEGTRVLSRMKRVAKKVDIPEQVVPELDTQQFSFLGDVDSEDFVLRKVKNEAQRIQGKATRALQQTEGIEVGDVAQAAKRGPKGFDEIQINYARITGPDDIKNTMQALANEPALRNSIKTARRGVRPNKITVKAAEDIDGFDTLISRRQGDAFNAEEITAARMLYYDSTDKLIQAAKNASTPEATAIDQFNFRKMVAAHHAIQKEVLGARAEAGRALQAWAIPLQGSGAEKTRHLEQLLSDFGGIDASQNLARKLAGADKLNLSQINVITRKSGLARTAAGLEEAWTLGLLTSPTTHVVNVSSNMLTTTAQGFELGIQSFIPDSGVKHLEPLYYWYGMLDAQKEAIKNSAKAFRTSRMGFGTGKLDLPRIRATSLDELDPMGPMKPLAMGMDLWGRVINNAGRLLAAGDEYSKTVAYKAQLKALSYRQGVDEGLSGTPLARRVAHLADDPPLSMAEEARNLANYVTFTNELDATSQKFVELINRIPGARYIIPFRKTPINIFKYTFQHTPLAPLSRSIRDEIAAGGARGAAAQAKIGLGTGIMAMGADMALQGKITGAGPTDRKARTALMRLGWKPYSVRVGDTYYSYARWEPLATVFGMSADTAEIMSNYENYDVAAQNEVEEAVSATVMVAGNQLINKTFLRGLADTFEMLSDPGRFGEGFVNRYAGSLVPAGVAAIERAIDPQKEHVFNSLDAIKARIPGNSVAKRFNVWGEPLQNFYPGPDGLLSATGERIASMINPFYYSEKVNSPIDTWLLKNGGSINMPQKNQVFIVGREKYDVDMRDFPEAYSRLVELRGNTELPQYGNMFMKEYLNELILGGVGMSAVINNPNRAPEDNVNTVRSVVSDYQRQAKKLLVEEFPEIIGKPREPISVSTQPKPFP